MTNGSAGPSHALFRTAVVIGCVALLLGVAGIFYFGQRDRDARARLPRDAAIVLLSGAAADAGLEVVVRWKTLGDTDVERHEEAGEPGTEAHMWLFRRAPAGALVELLVFRRPGTEREPLWKQRAILTRGGIFEVVLPGR